jgi:hypothetical protein
MLSKTGVKQEWIAVAIAGNANPPVPTVFRMAMKKVWIVAEVVLDPARHFVVRAKT